ncbi:uncharacterized protein GGS22DRAFT_197847 [Annulohypoxylon maeteangense]|uniref:uncharacterized protein n=1 Tax=Annulohypoxylon maeteangense TaxID=1927788 RepID=UPI0020073066|nr:uncharacterized protein GGS22DRAFT_197847 [Annulohypoxylon maeteangense]KAI0887927.1 hypothetical protein GGS22DRAFT_197847 [Annulohypoxylon maeteangense]
MKTSFTSVFSLIAVVAAIPTTLASPIRENALEARGASVPPVPGNNESWHCSTQDDSPGTSNIQVGADRMSTWNKYCGANSDGSAARMAAGDGYSLFIKGVHGQDGSFPCADLASLFIKIKAVCGKNINGDVRAGGSIWVPGYEGRTYVYATADSK